MKRGTWTRLLAAGFLVLECLAGQVSAEGAGPPGRVGPAVTILPEHFASPLCIFVRSESCPQSVGTTQPACDFHYDYPGPNGLFHPVCEEELFQALPNDVPVLILIHGSFVDFEEEPDLVETFEWIRAAAPNERLLVLCYRWPSSAGWRALLGSFAVCELAQRSEFNGFYLAQLINRIPAENSVRLLGHSHGCRMISAALHLLSGGRVDGQALPPRSWSNRGMRVTFFSAAIDHDWLNPGERYDLALNRMCWLQNHKHSCDWALLTYAFRYPGSSRALGQTGFSKKDLKRLGAQTAKIQQFDAHCPLLWGHSLKSHVKDGAIKPYVLSNIYSPCPVP